jgi:hypothetical protein
MQFSDSRNVTRWILISLSFVIISLILWNTYSFFQIFKEEERMKMELWANAHKSLMTANLDTEIELPSFILENNKNIPLILTNSEGKIISTLNLGDIENDTTKVKEFLNVIKKQNNAIKVQYTPNDYNLVYYGDSSLLNK